jgi:cell division protein FtsB
MAKMKGPSEKTMWRIVIIFFALYAGVTFGRLVIQELLLLHKAKVLQHEQVHVMTKRRDLLKKLSRANTPTGVEYLAREKLGLVKKGEIPIKTVERTPPATGSQITPTPLQ